MMTTYTEQTSYTLIAVHLSHQIINHKKSRRRTIKIILKTFWYSLVKYNITFHCSVEFLIFRVTPNYLPWSWFNTFFRNNLFKKCRFSTSCWSTNYACKRVNKLHCLLNQAVNCFPQHVIVQCCLRECQLPLLVLKL